MIYNKNAVIVFTKAPESGRTKTRLMPYLTGAECATLHEAFLRDIGNSLRSVDADCFIAYTGKEHEVLPEMLFGGGAPVNYISAEPPIKNEDDDLSAEDRLDMLRKIPGDSLDPKYPAAIFEQVGESFGEKVENAINRVLDMGYHKCLLISTDVPYASGADIATALGILDKDDYVFGPTEDGGYWLVGACIGIHGVLNEENFGSISALRHALSKLPDGRTAGLLDEKMDVDEISDLLRLRNIYRFSGAGSVFSYEDTMTARVLKRLHVISVIIPVFNEGDNILHIMEQVDKLQNRCEIIFVDGGSTDGTADNLKGLIADRRLTFEEAVANGHPDLRTEEEGAKLCRIEVIPSSGRGAVQLNDGVRASHGDVLFFFDPKETLPDEPRWEMVSVMKDHDIGCFGVRSAGGGLLTRTEDAISNVVASHKGVILGEQGVFVKRNVFLDAGGFQEEPEKEECSFVLNPDDEDCRIGMTRHRIMMP